MNRFFQFMKRYMLKLCWTRDSQELLAKPAEAQAAFLASLPEPIDDFERSFFQYKCQCDFKKPLQIFLMNCAAIPLLVIRSFQFRRVKVVPEPHCDAVFLGIGRDNIIPQSLREEFSTIHQVKGPKAQSYLSKEDLNFLYKLRRRYPFSFFFRYECMRQLATYSYMIACYSPKALICAEQIEFNASFLSAYCAMRGIEHINVMHGIQQYNITISFLRFDRLYVWNEYFMDLFMELRAPKGQFIVEVPPSIRFPQTTSSLEHVDYTYYVQDQTLPQVEEIAKYLLKLKRGGAKVAVRPHPLHRECAQPLLNPAYGLIVEDPAEVLIEDSVLRTDHVIAFFSTVLMQAYYNGRTAVIDDISAPEEYEELEKSCYMHTSMPHRLLSEIINEGERNDKANP